MAHNYKDLSLDFQTPPEVCRYMASLIPEGTKTVLEPTKGIGNIVAELGAYEVTAPDDYFLLDKKLWFDAVIMNPPFTHKSANLTNAPANAHSKGMKLGYRILVECMQKSYHVIALMPWFTLSDSDVRLRYLKRYGLKSITALPRKTFQYARIQTVVIELERGYTGEILFKVFEFIDEIPSEKSKQQLKFDYGIQ